MRKFTFLGALVALFMLSSTTAVIAQTYTAQETAELNAAQANETEAHVSIDALLQRYNELGSSTLTIKNHFTQAEANRLAHYFQTVNSATPEGGNIIVATAGATETFNVLTGDLFADPSDGVTGGPGGDCSTTDSGDPGDYPNCNCITVTTLEAPPGEQVSVTFTSFRVFGNFDWLAIFDGSGPVTATNTSGSGTNPTSGDPELWNSSVDGDELVDMVNAGSVTFTSTNGSLTFASRFSGVVATCGWEADITTGGGGGGGGSLAYGVNNATDNFINFDPTTPDVLNAVAPSTADGVAFEGGGAVDPSNTDVAYAMNVNGELYEVDVTTGTYTLLGTVNQPGGETVSGLEFNPVDGTLYMLTTDIAVSTLSTIDIGSVTSTPIGATGMAGGIALAIDGAGNAWSYDLVDDSFYSVDLTTGAATLVGPIGFNANFGQGMTWDPNTDQIVMTCFNSDSLNGEYRTVDTATGATTFVGTLGATTPGGLNQVAWVGFNSIAPPVTNDECENAIAVACGDVVSGDTTSDTNSGGNDAPDEWFSFTGTGSPEIVTLSTCNDADFDTVLREFDACGGNEIAFNDDSGGCAGFTSELTFLSDGTSTYFIMVEGFGTASGSFNLTVTCQDPEPNDLCDNAIAIECGSVTAGSTILASLDNDVASDCPNDGAGPDPVTVSAPGVWYVYEDTSGLVTDITLSTCDDADFDTKISVYTGDCTDLSCFAAVDDDPDCSGFTTTVDFQSDGNTTFYILVHGFGTAQGNFNLTMDCTIVPPDNDLIANAIDLDEVGCPFTDVGVQMPGATAEPGNPTDCDISGANGVWYKFTPVSPGFITCTILNPSPFSSVTFYTAPDESATETDLVLVDWFENQCLPGESARIPYMADQAYYVFVTNEGATTDIEFSECDSLGVGDNIIEGFVMYPNPANGTVNFSANDTIDSISIYNVLGQEVMQANVNATTTQLNVSSLSAGAYIVRASVNGETGTYQLMKN